MENDTTRTETCEIADEDVAVERTAEYRDSGAIVTLCVESRDSESAAFALLDEFPDGLPVADAAFRPGATPDGSRIGPDGVSIEGSVEPDEERTVVYAVKFFEPAPEADLGEPELVEEGARADRPGVGMEAVARGGAVSVTASQSDEESAPSQSDVEAVPPQSDVESTSSRAEDGGGTIGATLGLFDGDRRSSRPSRATDGGVSSPARADSSASEGATDTELVSTDWTDSGSNGRSPSLGRRKQEGSSIRAPEPVDADDGLVAALVAELRDGSVTEEERAVLRRELGAGRAPRDDARIERLERRLETLESFQEEFASVFDGFDDDSA